MTDLRKLYETDTVAWPEHQAAAVRAAALGGSHQPFDLENLVAEMEDLAKSLRRRLRSQIARIIQHHVRLELARYRPPQPLAAHDPASAARYQLEHWFPEELPR